MNLTVHDLSDDVLSEITKGFEFSEKKKLKLVDKNFNQYIDRTELDEYFDFYSKFEFAGNSRTVENLSPTLKEYKLYKIKHHNETFYLETEKNKIMLKLHPMIYFFDKIYSKNVSIKNNILLITFDDEILNIGLHFYFYYGNFYIFYLNSLIYFNVGGVQIFNFKDIIQKCSILDDTSSWLVAIKVDNKLYELKRHYCNIYKIISLTTIFDQNDFLIIKRIFNKGERYESAEIDLYYKEHLLDYYYQDYLKKGGYGFEQRKFYKDLNEKIEQNSVTSEYLFSKFKESDLVKRERLNK